MKLLVLAVLGILSPAATAQELDRELKKTIETIAKDWFDARPKSYFEEWNAPVEAELLQRAGTIVVFPDAGLEDVVEVLWKEVHDQAPSGRKRSTLPTVKQPGCRVARVETSPASSSACTGEAKEQAMPAKLRRTGR